MSKTKDLEVMYVGIDLHKTQFTVCAMSHDGVIETEDVFLTQDEGYQKFCRQMHVFKQDRGYVIKLAVEACGNARYFKNYMESEGFEVVVVNTNKFKVISTSTKKTDAHDAATLAYYLSKDMLPQSHLCNQSCDEIRRLLKTRSLLVSTTVKIKNQIHGMMLGFGVVTKAAQFQSKKARQQLLIDLKDHRFCKTAASSLNAMLDILDNQYVQIKQVEEQLLELTKDDSDVALLQTVPGIGFITASTIAAYTKDLDERFEGDFKRFASYLGIVPGVHISNEKTFYGPITKRGPMELRTAFVQAALGIIRQKKKCGDWRLVKSYEQMKKDKCSGKAIIATTRKVARIVFAMLQTRQPFNPSLMQCSM